MIATRLSAPASFPVSVDEAKSHLRIEAEDLTTADVATLTTYIGAATNYVEEYLRRRLVTQSWDYKFDEFPPGREDLVIPASPLQQVSFVNYLDPDTGATTVFSASDYSVDAPEGNPNPPRGRISLAYQKDWPTTRVQKNAVEVGVVVGYGDPADVPEAIRSAILLMVGNLYANREPVVTGTIATKMPMNMEFILSPYRLFEIK